MARRGKPNLKRKPAGEGKPGVPYIPIYPPRPDGGEWHFHYEKREWVQVDPYKDKDGKAA